MFMTPGASAADNEVVTLPLPKPAWLTDELEAKVVAAGPKGVEVPLGPQARLDPNCLGTAPPYAGTDGVSVTAVSAGTCMMSPHGCTMNFVFTDGTSSYIGTAGHCVAGGNTVIAQIATRADSTNTIVTVAAIGVFCGDPVGQPVMHYGHGYIFFVEQGYPKFGEVIPDLTLLVPFTSPEGFNWVGYGLPGDSGSGVMNDAGLAVGDLTHGISVAGLPVPGLSFGTDMTQIFNLIGSSYKLVTAAGLSADRAHPLGI